MGEGRGLEMNRPKASRDLVLTEQPVYPVGSLVVVSWGWGFC